MTLIHHSVSFTELPTDHLFPGDSVIEHQGLTITADSAKLNIINIYIPPPSCCPSGYRPNLDQLLSSHDDDTLIVGDFNAHNSAWYSQTEGDQATSRGTTIANLLNDSNLALLNENTPTRIPTVGPSSSPDLSIVTAHLTLGSTWTTHTTLSSDHLPITIKLSGWFPDPPSEASRTFTNIRRARWDDFAAETEMWFSRETAPTSCSAGEKRFRKILLRAAKHHIPAGFVRDRLTSLPDEAKRLARERDELREENPNHPQISVFNQLIEEITAIDNRERWRRGLDSVSGTQDTRPLWRLIAKMSNKKPRTPPNQPITFQNRQITDHHKIAYAFCKQFASTIRHTTDPAARRIKRQLQRNHPIDHTYSPFTTDLTQKAIKISSSSIATGPDGLTMLHLKHLGPRGVQYLTDLFNLSLQAADIPSIWKRATIVPIPKVGKPRHLGTSFRPISLLCPGIKVLERLLLPLLSHHLTLADTQHGFRQQRSTTSALLPLVHKVAAGFNQLKPPLRTVSMAIDLSKAFDTVNHSKLIQTIAATTLHHNVVRWLSAYLRGRFASCRYNEATSACHAVRAGVPQGSVISPLLFNFFVTTYPPNCQLHSTYADDMTAAESSVDPQTAADALTVHAEAVGGWAEERGLQISAPKSHVTLFTSHTHQSRFHPIVTLNNTILPLERHPRILGVTFDPHLTFTQHVQTTREQASERLKILKALAGTSWGQQKETITMTYKALVWSKITYAAPVWFPNISHESCLHLQRIQNAAMRIATGCHQRASQGHLHAETQLLPVSSSLGMLCSQYLASALRPPHPSPSIVTQSSGPRTIKQTLQSKFLPSINQYLTDGITPPDEYQAIVNEIHTQAVQDAILNQPPNPILQEQPPDIAPVETQLPRVYRTTLSQLRSGYCKSLNSFQHLINPSIDPSCPSCDSGEAHTTHHLFHCAAHPTGLGVRDLWDRPDLVSSFLASLPFFDYLPALPPPPPEPPPTGPAL